MALTPIIPESQYTNGCIIAYNNLIASSDDTTPADASPKAVIPNTFERWRPANGTSTERFNLSAVSDVTCIGIAAHNLSGQEINIQYSTTNGGGLTTLTTIRPTSNDPILLVFDAQSMAEVALNATWAGDREIGYIFAGNYLQMPIPIYGGHKPVKLSPDTEYKTNISNTGQFLGRTILRQGVETDYSFRYLKPSFVRGEFTDFVNFAKTMPFFIQWRPDLYPDEVAFGYTTDDIDISNGSGGVDLMEASFKFRGHKDT